MALPTSWFDHSPSLVLVVFLLLLLHTTQPSHSSSSPPTGPVHAIVPSRATDDDVPLPYWATTVTAAKVTMNASLVRAYDGADKNNIVVDIEAQGPVPFALARWNQGDFTPRLGPRHPYAQTNLGVPGGAEGYQSDNPMETPLQSWRPSPTRGVLLASVARNGQKWDDGTPLFYGTVSCVYNSQGYGYSMDTGEFGNDNPNIDIAVGKAGELGEANTDVAIAWFPYKQGWTAGYIAAPSRYHRSDSAKWSFPGAHSPDLPSDADKLVHWDARGASLKLPGVAPATDGMIFLTSTDPGQWNNEVNIMSTYVKKHHSEWRIQAREDAWGDASELVNSAEHMFAFLYVPFDAPGLIGASISSNGQVVRGAGDFSCRRLQTGQYEIIIGAGALGKPKTSRDGILLLQVMGREEGNHRFARHAFLSYNFSTEPAAAAAAAAADGGTEAASAGSAAAAAANDPSAVLPRFLVESHRLVKEPKDMFRETFPYTDTDFAFVWVDFRNPLAPNLHSYSGPLPNRLSGYRFWWGFLSGLLFMGLATVSLVTFLSYYTFAQVPASSLPLDSNTLSQPLVGIHSSTSSMHPTGSTESVSAEQELAEERLRGVYINAEA